MEDVLEGKQEEPAHYLAVMSKEHGDSKQIWDVDNEAEVAAARNLFNELTGKGYIAYSVEGEDGTKGQIVKEFDPQAGRIILSPPMVGG